MKGEMRNHIKNVFNLTNGKYDVNVLEMCGPLVSFHY